MTTLEDLDFRQDILGFSENVRSAVLLKLQQMPPQYRQDHIDEVAAHVQARIGTPKEIKNPASYLLKMCNAYLDDGELWITSRAEEFRNQAAIRDTKKQKEEKQAHEFNRQRKAQDEAHDARLQRLMKRNDDAKSMIETTTNNLGGSTGSIEGRKIK